MKFISVIATVFFLILALCNVSAASFDQVAELRTEHKVLIEKIKSISGISSKDYKSISKYTDKMIDFIEEKLSTSTLGISSIRNIYQNTIKKVSEKIQEKVKLGAEVQFAMFEICSEFFTKVEEILELNREEQTKNLSSFMAKLETMPERSISSHYLNFLRTLDNLESTDFGPQANKIAMLDTAVAEFCNNFVQTYGRDFASEINDETINQCFMAGLVGKFNEISGNLDVIVPRDAISTQKCADRLASDEF